MSYRTTRRSLFGIIALSLVLSAMLSGTAGAASLGTIPVTFQTAVSSNEFMPGGNVTTTYTVHNDTARTLMFHIGMQDVQDGVVGMPMVVIAPTFKWDNGKGLVWHALLKAHTSQSFTITTAATTAKSTYCTSVRSLFRYNGRGVGRSIKFCSTAAARIPGPTVQVG